MQPLTAQKCAGDKYESSESYTVGKHTCPPGKDAGMPKPETHLREGRQTKFLETHMTHPVITILPEHGPKHIFSPLFSHTSLLQSQPQQQHGQIAGYLVQNLRKDALENIMHLKSTGICSTPPVPQHHFAHAAHRHSYPGAGR